MFKKNQHHFQLPLTSHVEDLPEIAPTAGKLVGWGLLSGGLLSPRRSAVCRVVCGRAVAPQHARECAGGVGNAQSWARLDG